MYVAGVGSKILSILNNGTWRDNLKTDFCRVSFLMFYVAVGKCQIEELYSAPNWILCSFFFFAMVVLKGN